MGDKNREEELYLTYQARLRDLEEELGVQAKKQKKFDEKKERRSRRMADNQARVEEMAAQWGASAESARIYSMLDEYAAEERSELKKEAEALQEEWKNIKAQQQRCEEAYWEERNRLEENL